MSSEKKKLKYVTNLLFIIQNGDNFRNNKKREGYKSLRISHIYPT